MQEKRKRQSSTPQRGIGFLRQLIEQIRLSWALIRDDRVPTLYKLIPIIAIAYVISPLDFVPDVIPLLGQLDDIGIFFAALSMFNSLAPADVVAEHMERFHTGEKYKVIRDRDGIVIDMPSLSDPDIESNDDEALAQDVEQNNTQRSTKKAP